MVCCTSQTNSGVKYSKPVNTVSGCPHEYALCNVEMGLAGLRCNLDRVVTNYSIVRCSLYATEQLSQTFCGFTSKKEHILQLVLLQSGFHAYCQNAILKSLCHIIQPQNTSMASQQKQHYHRQPYKQYHSVEQSAVWLWVQRIQWPIMWPDVIIITKPST